jgi:hypothetical protein
MKLVEPKNPCEIQDFIFSMSPTCFQDYLKYISNITLKPPQESQNVLFDFSNLKKSMIVENVGIMRNEWNVLKQSFSFNNLIYT